MSSMPCFFGLNESWLVVSKVFLIFQPWHGEDFRLNPWDPMGQELRYQREELRRDELWPQVGKFLTRPWTMEVSRFPIHGGTPSYHPFTDGFSMIFHEINHSAIGVTPFSKTAIYLNMHIWICVFRLFGRRSHVLRQSLGSKVDAVLGTRTDSAECGAGIHNADTTYSHIQYWIWLWERQSQLPDLVSTKMTYQCFDGSKFSDPKMDSYSNPTDFIPTQILWLLASHLSPAMNQTFNLRSIEASTDEFSLWLLLARILVGVFGVWRVHWV